VDVVLVTTQKVKPAPGRLLLHQSEAVINNRVAEEGLVEGHSAKAAAVKKKVGSKDDKVSSKGESGPGVVGDSLTV